MKKIGKNIALASIALAIALCCAVSLNTVTAAAQPETADDPIVITDLSEMSDGFDCQVSTLSYDYSIQ